MKTIEFDYNLPEELIATYPSKDRTQSRLLIDANPEEHRIFSEIDKFINKDDLLILNNTSVLHARLFGKKETGGEVEVFLERIIGETTALVQIRSSRSPKPGTLIIIENNERRHKLLCKERKEGFFIVDFQDDPKKIFNSLGNTPLPPYIKRKIEREDKHRYQTVYENKDYQESVAAPTAGLHFDEPLLDRLKNKGINSCFVTLHVGLGTFKPVKVDNIKEHSMHSEWISVSKKTCDMITETKKNGGRVVAVGTTSLRSLETIAIKPDLEPFQGDTDIFICPGYEFKLVDALITNFHLPKSTLLMLVCAFAGYSQIMDAYKEAINKKYRFYSYGDAMFLNKNIDAKFDLPGL